jgi:hypothetical protein
MWFLPKGEYKSPSFGAIGRCRRHSPTLGGWPVVHEVDWCGDHKFDETKFAEGGKK